MLYNVYRTNSGNSRELCFKQQHRADVVEYATGKTVGDTLPVILSDEVAHIYYSLRLMKPGETFQCEGFLNEHVYRLKCLCISSAAEFSARCAQLAHVLYCRKQYLPSHIALLVKEWYIKNRTLVLLMGGYK